MLTACTSCVNSVHFDLEDGAISDDAIYSDMRDTINAIRHSRQRMTNIAHSLSYVASMIFNNHGDRDTANDVIIVFTDGEVCRQLRLYPILKS